MVHCSNHQVLRWHRIVLTYIFQLIIQINYGSSFIEFFAEEAKRVYGDIIPPTLADRRLFVLKQVKWHSSMLFISWIITRIPYASLCALEETTQI